MPEEVQTLNVKIDFKSIPLVQHFLIPFCNASTIHLYVQIWERGDVIKALACGHRRSLFHGKISAMFYSIGFTSFIHNIGISQNLSAYFLSSELDLAWAGFFDTLYNLLKIFPITWSFKRRSASLILVEGYHFYLLP